MGQLGMQSRESFKKLRCWPAWPASIRFRLKHMPSFMTLFLFEKKESTIEFTVIHNCLDRATRGNPSSICSGSTVSRFRGLFISFRLPFCCYKGKSSFRIITIITIWKNTDIPAAVGSICGELLTVDSYCWQVFRFVKFCIVPWFCTSIFTTLQFRKHFLFNIYCFKCAEQKI